jgi:signal transduction histidine kinase
LEEQLFHIAQKALNNSLRHAFASEVIARIKVDEANMLLSVEDDGQGFDLDTVSYGLGLVNMKERAQSIGTEIAILSELGQGTLVKVSLPLP